MFDKIKILGISVSHQIYKPEHGYKKIKHIVTASLILVIAVIAINFFDFKLIRNAYAATITSGLGDIFDKQENREMFKFLKNKTKDRKIAGLILKYSIKNNIDEILMLSLINVESKLETDAVNYNRDGSVDRGLCQLNSSTFKDVDEEQLFDPETNIRLGTEYLSWCLKIANYDVKTALMYYNAGFGNVANNNIGKTTYRYISKILYLKKKYDGEYVKLFL